MKHNNFLCTIALLACLSCSTKQKVTVEYKDYRPLNMSSFVTFQRNILLDTPTEESRIQDFHIGRLLFAQERIYVIDEKENKILMFDDEGKFLKSIGGVTGEISGNRLKIQDATLDAQSQKLYAYCNTTCQIMVFDLDLNVEQQIERPQLKIQPKREMLAKFGITLPEFSEYVNVALAGKVISQVYEQGKSFDLIVKVKNDARDEMEKIRNLMVDTNDGRKVPLSYVAEVTSAMGPNTINRENVKRKIVISANVADRDLRSVVNDIRKQIDASVQLPEGYHIECGGQFESEQAASRTLALTSFISIVVIFLLLYHEFRSVKESGVILLNLPLALIGGVFALVLTTGEVSIPAIIGFISLFGIATRNGMLLISHYNHLQQVEGLNVYDSVMQGSLDRLNPILMTALSSALALIPLALGGDLPGNEIQSPMAKVILGGLLTSTFLNGFIVPIVYLMMHRKKASASL